MKNPSFFALSVLLGGAFSLQAQNLVTNGDFENYGAQTPPIIGASPEGWNSTINPAFTGQFDPGATGNNVAYMSGNATLGSQMFQTFLDVKLQPNTTYTVTFNAQVSMGAGPFPAYLFTDVSYGTGSAGTSAFGGYIAGTDLRSGSTSNFAPLSNTPQTFTYTFTTNPTITGSASDIAFYMQPSTGFEGTIAAECYIDNVSVVATPATIVYGGTQTGGFANSYVVENWSNAGAPKAYDVDGDNKYGSAGYVQFRPWGPWTPGPDPAPFPGAAFIYEGIPDAFDLGTTAATAPSVVSQPSFVSLLYQGGTAANSHFFVNFDGYSVFTTADGLGLTRQGGISLPVPGGGATPAGNANWGNAMVFQLSQNKTFRLGVVVDAVGSGGAYSPDYVSVYSVAQNKTFHSAPLVRDGNPDMVFFDIEGTSGDTIAVSVWQAPYVNIAGPADGNPVGLSMLTFDEIITEPSEPPVLSYSRSGSNFTLSWPTTYTSWILESSIDLGDQDLWDPVPGVVENSVTLDMTGFPKNFFRLKKN